MRPGAKFRVRALHTGYYGEKRWREGDVFTYTLGAKETKLPKWVEPVPARTPGQLTSGKEVLRKQHDEILASRMPAQGSQLVDDEPEVNPLGD